MTKQTLQLRNKKVFDEEATTIIINNVMNTRALAAIIMIIGKQHKNDLDNTNKNKRQ